VKFKGKALTALDLVAPAGLVRTAHRVGPAARLAAMRSGRQKQNGCAPEPEDYAKTWWLRDYKLGREANAVVALICPRPPKRPAHALPTSAGMRLRIPFDQYKTKKKDDEEAKGGAIS